ncbi:winged helix-turn-helix domain-containing protein [Marinicella litoralis]|uniref:DNA-binding winged helix-turn-helix (WHTH) protein n=1 Tax=Marinicella litoralis TaxID=644220 RepID=A0A4R6XRV3_9GAMM|nr:winged helix-turn-helix domain-containing protein [Marinicella litoralis]TDR22642.1 DNA-binding winged helix-turn-helix (wHTH) protein [Marinicella litoralis]
MKKVAESMQSKPIVWLIGEWRYHPDNGLLKNNNNEVRLSTQLNLVLSLLIEHAPNVVTRQQFLDHVWHDKYVNEDALSRTIAELRKILGDSASQAKYIKTIPKKGYQLTQMIEPLKARNVRVTKSVGVLLFTVSVLLLSVYFNQQESMESTLQTALAAASRVTFQPGMEQQSELSEDGAWLSYVRNDEQGSQIIIESMLDANQQQIIQLAHHSLSSPVFLSDQNLLIFTAREQSQCHLKSYHISKQLFVDLGTCFFNAESRTIDWNSVTQKLYYADQAVGDGEALVGISQLDLKSNEKSRLTFPASSNQQDWSPRVSPDQKYLSFSRGNQSVRNLWIKSFISGKEWPLTLGEHYSVSHDWYDDDHIVFDSDLSGSRQLWLLNIHEKSPVLLGAYGAQHPSFDQRRSTMTFQVVSYEANIWMFDTKNKSYQRLIHSTKYDNYPAFSPNGTQFLFSSNRQDQSSIWIYDFKQSKEKLLVTLPNVKLTRPSWHSNGRDILITTNDNKGYGTLVFNSETLQTHTLDFGQGHLASREYQGVFFALAKSKEVNNKILQLKAGKVTVLPPQSVSRFMILSDGRLVYSSSVEAGLFIYDPLTEKSQLLTPSVRMSAMNLWTAINQAVYFDLNSNQSAESSGIWRLDVTTGDQTFITSHRPYSVGTSLSVNRAEDRLLITRTDRAESDVLRTQLQ